MLLQSLKGKSTAELMAFTMDDMIKMLGIPLTPTRLKCAVLGLQALSSCFEKEKQTKSV